MKTLEWMAIYLFAWTALQAVELPDDPLSVAATRINGETVQLGVYTGKVVLVVNVASRCGYTKQYRQLQSIYEKFAERGLVVLGFPCNQFGAQEPGTDAEIQAFCQKKFAVSFPMFSKIDVNGEHAHPLYQYLTSGSAPIDDRGPVKWNFEKFLIDRTGRVIGRFRSRVTPDAPEMINAIETALGRESVIP
ncbi:MAG: glutathione peroxidase [Kiritimatiellia bacterium]|nr:glutathione peroxidase [Lentisphaerota bacterium]